MWTEWLIPGVIPFTIPTKDTRVRHETVTEPSGIADAVADWLREHIVGGVS